MSLIKRFLRSNKFTSDILETYFFSKNYLRGKGWFISRFLYEPLDIARNPIPWFTYSSIHFISQKLKDNSFRVFEFGSGNSTIWFASRVNFIISIEHDREYYLKIKKKLSSFDNIQYDFRDLTENYSSSILEFNDSFDIIIIDGRQRVDCVRNSLKALKNDGVIIWDNSDRPEYQEGYDFLESNGFKKIDFRGVGPIGHVEWQTTIYYKNDNCFNI